MKWNYRIIDHGDHLALHEVYYDDAGQPSAFTTGPVTFVCDPEDGARGLIWSLEKALVGATARPVLKSVDVGVSTVLDDAREIAAVDDGLAPVAASLALVAETMDEAEALADRHGRPVRFVWRGRPVTIYPKGTKPEALG
ncbi:hypothetical protein [Sphingomonas sp. LH128]|uniref:hypothetical protein n=1 Tax=Sphingomonas sp. LH128 TaxID=473781 RepID=UPI0002D4E95E|nr:hypothetical protein [Sphingomonas sp. LH128]